MEVVSERLSQCTYTASADIDIYIEGDIRYSIINSEFTDYESPLSKLGLSLSCGDSYEIGAVGITSWIEIDREKEIKRQAITELLEQHKKDRAKVSSKSDLINMSTVERYLRSLE